ncbi:T9SS type A sorting domain-containing protein [Sphingobacterium sp. SRCM116780]|uniref:T9SS type A sorting domain-containing protein n=1 Tax=Sphingobacterium sp. SRCM116780 TaxID=2907623 RepID=UPI001F23C3BE|nr:T9SS type A sorting domain-containing protein [Sphingobacterium sp. SRCM116780]UIR55086.1 T9SS type A sorting domain-containing protein [Sphingobacterium sp. SRCM116780]
MKINMKKIAYLCLLSVISLTGSLGYASVLHVSKSIQYEDNQSYFDRFDRVSYTNSFRLVSESSKDVDKLINNVKVFYNPISEQISLSFKLGKQTSVAIKVMDALGNEVLQLMNGTLDAGNQNLSFDPSGKLNSGFYFVRVVSGSETVVKRFSVR